MKFASRFSLVVSTIVMFCAVHARGESPRFGVQVHANIPSGHLKDTVDDKIGFGLGTHVTFDLGGGQIIRPRVDYIVFPEATKFTDYKDKVNNLSAGADYLYFLSGKPEGFYLTAGLSFNHWKVEASVPPIGTFPAASGTFTSNKLGFAAGIGFNYNASFGAELRFTSSKYSLGALNTSITANALQAGVTFRF